jgi:colanic acid/amylovoran biosynthesis glycosyltransferase
MKMCFGKAGSMPHVPQPIKILMVGLGWPPETFLQRLIRGLAEAGVEVTVATDKRPGAEWSGHANFQWLPAPAWGAAPVPKRLVLLGSMLVRALINNPKELWRLLKINRTDGCRPRLITWYRLLPFIGKHWDVIYFPWIPVEDYFPLFNNGVGVVSCRGSQINVAPHGSNRRDIIKSLQLTFHKAAAIHCVSEAIKTEARQYGLDPVKAWVIRPAVDPDFFCPARPPKIKASTFRIIAVGSLIWLKGYEYALLAVRRLRDRGVPVQFHIIGNGAERSRLLYTIVDLELQGQVHLLGRLSAAEVRSQLQQADVFLLASLCEGISNAVLEAMACGLPVVTTDCGGVREAVTDGVEGFVVPGGDPEAMAAALAQLAFDREKRQKMRERGRARIIEHFTLERQVQDFIKMYQISLSNNSKSKN